MRTCYRCSQPLPIERISGYCSNCTREKNEAFVPGDQLAAKAAEFMYSAGMTCREIGEWWGVSSSLVYFWKRWAGWEKLNRHMRRTLYALRHTDVPGLYQDWETGATGERVCEAGRLFGWDLAERFEAVRGREPGIGRCGKCLRTLPIEEFARYRDPRRAGGGGIRTHCKDCRRVLLLRHRALRRDRRKAVDDGSVTGPFLRQLRAKVRWCMYCETPLTPKNRTLEHINPLAKGGKHTAKNVTFCCKTCNSRKGDRPHGTMATHEQRSLELA